MKFKLAIIFFIIIILTELIIVCCFGSSWLWLLLPVPLFLAAITYGSAVIQANFFMYSHCSAPTLTKEISLTFDDGPHQDFTPKILNLLLEFKVSATFFVIGKHCVGNSSLLQKIHAAGHVLGNHSYSHSPLIDLKNSNALKRELLLTSDSIFEAIGKRPKLFRPPYGVTTPALSKASKELDYTAIGWSIRSMDTTNDNEEKIVNRVLKSIKPGAIILLHDSSEKTVNVLKQILIFASNNNYKIVGLKKLLAIQTYH